MMAARVPELRDDESPEEEDSGVPVGALVGPLVGASVGENEQSMVRRRIMSWYLQAGCLRAAHRQLRVICCSASFITMAHTV